MGGPNLEVFKFGLYIMFPIGIMYYFGTNLDGKFSVPGFWPTKEQTHRIPTEKAELDAELERLKNIRLALRRKRLEEEGLQPGQIGNRENSSGSNNMVESFGRWRGREG